MIEQAAHQYNRHAAEIFLEEWSTMGKKRPTLRLLLDLLIKAELFRAADYIACDILQRNIHDGKISFSIYKDKLILLFNCRRQTKKARLWPNCFC